MKNKNNIQLLNAIKYELENYIIPYVTDRQTFAAAMIKRAIEISIRQEQINLKDSEKKLLKRIYGEKTKHKIEDLCADIQKKHISDEQKLIRQLYEYTIQKLEITNPEFNKNNKIK